MSDADDDCPPVPDFPDCLVREMKIVNRKTAAKVAEKAGEVPKSVGKKLHSHDLRRAEGIKKHKGK